MSDQNSSEKNEQNGQHNEQANQGQPQPQQPYQQQFQGQPQQPYQQQYGQYAPSAMSAPQPGYGYSAPARQPSGFATMFSTNFDTKGGRPLAKIVMLLAMVAFGIFAAYQLFDLIDLLTMDHARGMMIVTGLFGFVFAIAKGLVVLGGIRLLLERVPDEDNAGN